MLLEKPWKLDGLLRFVTCLVMCVSAMLTLSAVIQHFTGAKTTDDSSALVVVNSLALDGSILISVFIFLRLEHLTWSGAFGFKTRTFWHALMWGIIVAVCFSWIGQKMYDFCVQALQSIHIEPQNEQAVESLRKAAPGFNRIYLIFFSIIIAPFAEEILFRGLLYPTIKQCGFPRTALWGTSAMFAAIHLNLPAFFPLSILALVLTILYEKTNNLLACVIAHSLFNATGVVLLYHYAPVAQPPY